jgi:hypothetical protein
MTAPKKSREERKRRLTVRQQKLVEALTMSKSIAEAATVAGYSDRTAASPALKGISETAPEVLEGVGASIGYVVNNCLRPLMEAKETKFFTKAGIVLDTREVPALDARIRALEIWAKLIGAYMSQKVQVSGGLFPDFSNVSDDELDQTISNLLEPPRPTPKS